MEQGMKNIKVEPYWNVNKKEGTDFKNQFAD